MGFALFVVLGAWFVKTSFLSALDNGCLCLHILSADAKYKKTHIYPRKPLVTIGKGSPRIKGVEKCLQTISHLILHQVMLSETERSAPQHLCSE